MGVNRKLPKSPDTRSPKVAQHAESVAFARIPRRRPLCSPRLEENSAHALSAHARIFFHRSQRLANVSRKLRRQNARWTAPEPSVTAARDRLPGNRSLRGSPFASEALQPTERPGRSFQNKPCP